MLRYKYPFEYEVCPETLEKGVHCLILQLKNNGRNKLRILNVMMHSRDSLQISFCYPGDFIATLRPNGVENLNFEVNADGTTEVYASVIGQKNGDHFYWDSPWIRIEVTGELAELESMFVSSHYGTIGNELEVEATVRGIGNTEGLILEFWADTPSGKYEELAKIKTKNYSKERKHLMLQK